MRLGEKFSRIRSGEFTNFITTPLTDEIRGLHRFAKSINPAGYFFEQQSQLSSPWICNATQASARFVGAYSYMNDSGYLRGSILIGRYCSIGRRVTVGAPPHEMGSLSSSPRIHGRAFSPYTDQERNRIYQSSPRSQITEIQSDVWIGDGAIIMPGITLAIGTVVGANAVVTKDTTPYEIVGGVPARTIGHRFDSEIIQALLETQWWEHEIDVINGLPSRNIFEFLAAFAKEGPEPFAFQTWKVEAPAAN